MAVRQEFIENVFLLLLTAVVTGMLVPLILKRVDERKLEEQKKNDERRLREQKEFEAQLARQAKLIEAQVQLLESLSKQLWEFTLLALAVSWYRLNGTDESYQSAFEEYDAKSWSYFGTIRTEVSKARRLTSDQTYRTLLNFYKEWLINMDKSLVALVKKNAPLEEWSAYYESFQPVAGAKIDEIMNRLADEFRLSERSEQN